jgi:hypothetical protein
MPNPQPMISAKHFQDTNLSTSWDGVPEYSVWCQGCGGPGRISVCSLGAAAATDST